MFKKRAFLIPIALLGFNFLLPNQVRSSPVNSPSNYRYKVGTNGKQKIIQIIYVGPPIPLPGYGCAGKDLAELKKNCSPKKLKNKGMKKVLQEALLTAAEELR